MMRQHLRAIIWATIYAQAFTTRYEHHGFDAAKKHAIGAATSALQAFDGLEDGQLPGTGEDQP